MLTQTFNQFNVTGLDIGVVIPVVVGHTLLVLNLVISLPPSLQWQGRVVQGGLGVGSVRRVLLYFLRDHVRETTEQTRTLLWSIPCSFTVDFILDITHL